jgi:hypothetical protein
MCSSGTTCLHVDCYLCELEIYKSYSAFRSTTKDNVTCPCRDTAEKTADLGLSNTHQLLIAKILK